MELGGEEDDTGSGCNRSMSGSDATMNIAATKQQALRLAEDLSLPSVRSLSLSLYRGQSVDHHLKSLMFLLLILQTQTSCDNYYGRVIFS